MTLCRITVSSDCVCSAAAPPCHRTVRPNFEFCIRLFSMVIWAGIVRKCLEYRTTEIAPMKLLIDIPDRWGILTAHLRRFGMKHPVYEQIQDRKVKSRLRMLQHAQ